MYYGLLIQQLIELLQFNCSNALVIFAKCMLLIHLIHNLYVDFQICFKCYQYDFDYCFFTLLMRFQSVLYNTEW